MTRNAAEGPRVEASATRPRSSAVPVSQPSLAETLASVVAINVTLVERILDHGAWLRRQHDEGLITRHLYGGEMYRLAKAVRHANDLLVVELADYLPPPNPRCPVPGTRRRAVGNRGYGR
jgi:hypothetical protein